MKASKIILLSSAGTGTAFASVLALRRNWGTSVMIILADSNPRNLVTSSLFSDKYFQVPLNNDIKFKKGLERIIIEENVDTYIPHIDHEIYIGALLYEEKNINKELKMQVKNSVIADICDDKFKTFLFLSENNILTPHCYLPSEVIHQNESLISKPRKGFGSKIVNLSKTKNTISDYNSDCFIIQQECKKPEITVDVCYDRKRDFFTYVCRERIETKSGVCSKARLFYDEKIENIAFKIADKLDLSSFCFQLMKLKEEWAVTDINARLGAGTAMSVAAGNDFFSGMYAIIWEEDPTVYFQPLQKETFVTRQYSEFIMNL